MPFRIGELLSEWVRPNYDKLMFPYRPPHIQREKEVRSVYLVHLEPEAILTVPGNWKAIAVPLFELYDNAAHYGGILASVPQMVSRLHINCC